MKRVFSLVSLTLLIGLSVVAVDSADANGRKRQEVFRAWLSGFEEAPNVISSTGRGFFRAIVDEDAGTIDYRLTYSGLDTATITQSHLHMGQHHMAGGIVIFLCSNLTTPAPPPGTQACPASPGQIAGTIRAENVLTAAQHGIAATELSEVVDAIRNRSVYVNLHTAAFPAGEIRGQLVR